jgi:hypothetical protein
VKWFTHRAHNPETAGSVPAAATNFHAGVRPVCRAHAYNVMIRAQLPAPVPPSWGRARMVRELLCKQHVESSNLFVSTSSPLHVHLAELGIRARFRPVSSGMRVRFSQWTLQPPWGNWQTQLAQTEPRKRPCSNHGGGTSSPHAGTGRQDGLKPHCYGVRVRVALRGPGRRSSMAERLCRNQVPQSSILCVGSMRAWRNWQTRNVEVVVSYG